MELPEIRCFMPWQQMVVDATTGSVNPCGEWRGNESCGNVHQNSLLKIWNSPVYQRLRAGMAAGDLEAAGCANCYALIKQRAVLSLVYDAAAGAETPPASEYAKNLALLRREIAAGASVLKAGPTILSMTFTHHCNIRCLHCCQESTRNLPLRRAGLYAETMELAPVLSQLILGGGEPFADPHWKRFFAEWDTGRNPYLNMAVTTNATLIDEAALEALGRFKTLTLNVSFDGGTREVYEKIRVGAKFDQVVAKVEKLRDLARAKGNGSNCGLSCSVMKSNILDLPNFLRLARSMSLPPPGLSPVVAMPPSEALTMFNDFQRDTAGWREVFTELAALCTDDFMRPLYQAISEQSTATEGGGRAYAPVIKALEASIPWSVGERPAYAVRLRLPSPKLRAFAARVRGRAAKRGWAYRQSAVLVLFPAAEHYETCRYYAYLDEHGAAAAALPEDTYHLGLVETMTTPRITHPRLICRVKARSGGEAEVIWGRETNLRVLAVWLARRLWHSLPLSVQLYLRDLRLFRRLSRRLRGSRVGVTDGRGPSNA